MVQINGMRGVPFTHELNGQIVGDLPPGLTFANNLISGTPETTGIYKFTVVQNSGIVDGIITIKDRIFKGFYRQADS